MATRTISDAGGNWNATGTWVEGVVPVAADAVVAQADGTSGNLVINAAATCRSFNLTNYTRTVSGSAILTISNSTANVAFLISAATTWTTTSPILIVGGAISVGTVTITTNGKTLNNLDVNYTAKTAVSNVTLADALTVTNYIQIYGGTFNTAGMTVTCSGFGMQAGIKGNTLTLGASTINVTGSLSPLSGATYPNAAFDCYYTSGSGITTLTANTATINMQGAGAVCTLNGKTHAGSVVFTGGGTCGYYTGGSLKTLTYTGTASVSDALQLDASTTITSGGAWTINGNSTKNRLLFCSATYGTNITVTATGTLTGSNCDFRNITMSAAKDYSAWTGGSGNCGGNTNITFTVAANQYWHKDSGNWSTTGSWFLATNGGGGAGRIPLPQDTAYFDANSFDSGSQTVTMDMPRIGGMIWTNAANTPTWDISSMDIECHLGFTLINGMAITTGTKKLIFNPVANATFNVSTVSLYDVVMYAAGAFTATLGANLTSTGTFYLGKGTFTGNGNNVIVNAVDLRYGATNLTRALTTGAGTWTLNGTGNIWTMASTTSLTLTSTAGNTIVVNDTSATDKTFAGNGLTYKSLTITGGGAGSVTFSGSNSFTTFTIGAPKTVIFTSATTQTVTSFVAAGTIGNVITIQASTPGLAGTLSDTTGTNAVTYCSIKDSAATGGATWTDTDGTNVSGNAGWSFLSSYLYFPLPTFLYS